jgi:capsular exopolysaccharide synthesis family protein
VTAIEPYREPERAVVVSAPMRGDEPERSDEINVPGILAAFRRHIGLFFGVVAATIALVIVFLFVYPPRYTATARVTVNTRAISTTPDKETAVVSQLPVQSSSDVDTEAQVIQSRRVALRVVDMLHLDKDPEFSSNRVGPLQQIGYLFAPRKAKSKSDEVINAVLGGLQPARFLTTTAIDINYTNHNPKKAQKIANAFAQAYLDDQVQAKYDQNRQVGEGIMAQLDALRAQAGADAAKVDTYKVQHNLMSVGQVTLTEQEISAYDQSVAAAKVDAAGDKANVVTALEQLAHGSNGEDVGQALNSPVITALREQRAEVSAKLASLEGHYGPRYPDLAQAHKQLADLDQEIQAEIQRIISSLAAKAAVSQKRLETMQATLAATKQELAANNQAQAGLDDVVRAAAVSQQIYEAYLARSKETIAQSSNLLPDSQIVSYAGLPETPSFPVALLFIPLGVVAGVLFGCAAVLMAELNERRLMSGDDVENRLGRPCLGVIPLLYSVTNNDHLRPIDAMVKAPASAYGEAFRALRAGIGLSSQGPPPSVVLITSAFPQEGKTTVALGLARTSALQGVSTVVMDCDARRSGLTRVLRLERDLGLLDVLAGRATLEEALVLDQASGALILPIGGSDEPSQEVLGGEAMDAVLEELRERARIVIMDTAPVLAIAATRVLAAKADAVVMAAHWRKTSEAAVRAALKLLPLDHARLAGVVLTLVDTRLATKYGAPDASRYFKKFRPYFD